MPADIRIREYTDADLAAVITIFQRSVREVANRAYRPEQIAVWSKVNPVEWRDWRLTRPCWIAEIAGQAAGFSDLEADGHLDMMFVHPEFQSQGVATALLNQVEGHARRNSLRRIFTEASLIARPFFLRRGFHVIAEQTILGDGVAFITFRMEKWLA